MSPEADRVLTSYLIEVSITNEQEQQNNTFWFPTPENRGKTEGHSPKEQRILRQLHILKEKEKVLFEVNRESRRKFIEPFDWTDTLQTNVENKKWKTFWLSIMIFLLDIQWILGWTHKSKWNSHPRWLKLIIVKAYHCFFVTKQVPFLFRENPTEIYSTCGS